MAKPEGVGIDPINMLELMAKGNAIGKPVHGAGLLPDWAIREFVKIEDFVDYDACPPGTVSYGLSSGGYDPRAGGRYRVFTNVHSATVSPKHIKPECYVHFDRTGHKWFMNCGEMTCGRCGHNDKNAKLVRSKCPEAPEEETNAPVQIPPNSFALAETVELLYIPRNVMCICLGKSSYARCGINLNFTPFEPGWFGIVTVEIINATPLPVEIIPWQGIGQALFFLMAAEPERAYGDKRNAKYQGQDGLTLPFVK